MPITIIMANGEIYDPAVHFTAEATPEPMIEASDSTAAETHVDVPQTPAAEETEPPPPATVSAQEPSGGGEGGSSEPMRLSPTIAKVLLARSPLHAWDEHRLGGGAERESSSEMDVGKVCEKLLLGVGPEIVALQFENYKTKAAQAARAEAEAARKLPILAHQQRHYDELIEAWGDQLRARGIEFRGRSQVTLTWTNPDSGVPCKGILDHLIVDETSGIIYDLKSCTDASDDATDRAIVKFGYDIQHAAYLEGANLTYPHLAGAFKVLFIFAETWRPWAINVRPFAGSMAELGEHKWQRACRTWGLCLERNKFHGYEQGNPVEAKTWQLEDNMTKQIAAMENDNATAPF